MPQLMPLLWVMSSFMFLLILMVLVDMYYYGMNGEDLLEFNVVKITKLNYLW